MWHEGVTRAVWESFSCLQRRCIERCKNAEKEDTIKVTLRIHRFIVTCWHTSCWKSPNNIKQPQFLGSLFQVTKDFHCSEGEAKNDGKRNGLCPDGTSRWSPRSHIVPWPSREVWYVELIYQARERKWTYNVTRNKTNATPPGCACAQKCK